MNTCPCCKRAIPKPRLVTNGVSKMYAQDVQKAQDAIQVIERTIERNCNELAPIGKFHTIAIGSVPERPEFLDACGLELTRLRLALGNPEMLWSIYRRKYPKSGPAYGFNSLQEAA